MFNTSKKYIFRLILADIAILLVVFWWIGFHSVRSDTEYFVDQIRISRGELSLSDLHGETRDLVYFRLFKPLYGVVSIGPFGSVSPENVILILNIIFLFGLSIFSYYFFRLLTFEDELSFFGALWVASGYPVLKYGLALVTDISGWFFAVATIVVFLYAIRSQKISYIFGASVLGFLGSISKETGVLGLLFCGVYLLMNLSTSHVKEGAKKLFALCAPFVFLQAFFMLFMSRIHGPSFLSWVHYNYTIYFHDFYKLRYFITNEFLAFHVVWVFALAGCIYFIKDKAWRDKEKRTILVASFLPSLLILCWPVFYYRVLYVQMICVVPLALFGISRLREQFSNILTDRIVRVVLWAPPIVSVFLYMIIQKY